MIRYASTKDLDALSELDGHISKTELLNVIKRRCVIVSTENGKINSWLRYGLFWDNLPFMNMLYIIDGERGNGLGTALCDFWERELKELGYSLALTSTLSDERGQLFYRKRGYRDCGSLILPNEVTEIIMYKKLEDNDG